MFRAGPDNYLAVVRGLRPGDTLVLQPGIYDVPDQVPGLPIFDLHGMPQRPITITGAPNLPRPVFMARDSHNTIRIANASYITIANLELDGRDLAVDAVKAQGPSHHITIENLLIRRHGNNQQTVGISTKAPAWRWIVRGNTIEGAGTGMYFGSPDGTWPFVAGVIENNVVVDSLGYNVQIKHQIARPSDIGMPADATVTIIRHNVFSKERRGSTGSMARPNVLVGHFPLRGHGESDRYAIYGNFFYQNPTGECLFQGEGNIALYSNVFINRSGSAVCIQPHNSVPRAVSVFRNTILARDTGIRLVGGHPNHMQVLIGNAVFASEPLRGGHHHGNVTGSLAAAGQYLVSPQSSPGRLDLSPRLSKLSGSRLHTEFFPAVPDVLLDFQGTVFDDGARGAYRSGTSSPWPLPLSMKPSAGAASVATR